MPYFQKVLWAISLGLLEPRAMGSAVIWNSSQGALWVVETELVKILELNTIATETKAGGRGLCHD